MFLYLFIGNQDHKCTELCFQGQLLSVGNLSFTQDFRNINLAVKKYSYV